MEAGLAYTNSALTGEFSKGKYRQQREMAWGSRITLLPSQQAKPTGENGVFALRVKSPATVMAWKHVPMQCEEDPAEGSAGQDIWPSDSDKEPSGQNLQSHPSSANQRFFTTSITDPRKLIFQACSWQRENSKHGERREMEKGGGRGKGVVLCENSLWEKKPFPQQPLQQHVSLTLLAEGRGQQH